MKAPFDRHYQLYELPDLSDESLSMRDRYLPGQPRILLTGDSSRLYEYLQKDLYTCDLDRMAPHLWLMAMRSSANISPLHHQKIKGRNIVLTEDPGLHLIWIDERIFVKPLPPYLLSHDFWEIYILPDAATKSGYPYHTDVNQDCEKLVRAALGLLRSYRFLLQYQSDLDCAIDHRLLPLGTSFESFCLFSSKFGDIADHEVSPRYGYGELRLSRLNLWSKVWLRRWHYCTIYRQYGQYFSRFYGPLLFIFGCFSVMLGALQVEMAVESTTTGHGGPTAWPHIWVFSRVFSVMSLCVVGFPSLVILALLIGKPLFELRYALTH